MTTPTPGQIEALHRLAALYEIETSFTGFDGKIVTASPETLLLVLKNLGAQVEGFDGLDAAYEARLRDTWHWKLDAVAVAWDGESAGALLRLPRSDAADDYTCRLLLEDDGVLEWQSTSQSLRAGPQISGEPHVGLVLKLPPSLPLGYHRLEVEAAGRVLSATIISAPRQAYGGGRSDRDWGIFLPLYAAHSDYSQGVGDYSDLVRLTRWAGSLGASFVGTLPLLATFLGNHFEPSPYSPVTRLFWNEVFVDTGRRADGQTGSDSLVDYRTVMAEKRRSLEEQADAFFASTSELSPLPRPGEGGQRPSEGSSGAHQRLQAFLQARPEAEDYARFRATQERYGANWRSWPAEARSGHITSGEYDEAVFRFYLYAQLLAHEQMSEVAGAGHEGPRPTEVYLDLPVGVNPDGYDAWRYEDVFAGGMSVGAPPDPLTSNGQDWGFAPLNPNRLRESGYEYVARYLRHNLSLGGLLRIDHIFGMYRLYCLPAGTDAREGVYVRYNTEELFAVLCLESLRGKTRVIGEDIGITPPGFRELMAEHGVGRLYVLTGCIAGDDETPVVPIPEGAMASFATHDLPPFAAFWSGEDLEERTSLGILDGSLLEKSKARRVVERDTLAAYLRNLGLLHGEATAESVMRATQAMLAASPAGHVMINLEDCWLETASQNVPGTGQDRHPNWRRRAKRSLEQIVDDVGVGDTLRLVAEKRAEGG